MEGSERRHVDFVLQAGLEESGLAHEHAFESLEAVCFSRLPSRFTAEFLLNFCRLCTPHWCNLVLYIRALRLGQVICIQRAWLDVQKAYEAPKLWLSSMIVFTARSGKRLSKYSLSILSL